MSNPIEHPHHYNTTKFEVWDILDEWFPNSPLLWNVGKYIARANHKGKPIEDLKKARAYLDREIARLEKVSTVETKWVDMTLDQIIGLLPKDHDARRELSELRRAAQ